MMNNTIVAKFGGTSAADAAQIRKIGSIVRDDPARRFIVVSAPGKRFREDIKVTDLLQRCYEAAENGTPFEADLELIRKRFQEIISDLGLSLSLEEDFEKLRGHLQSGPQREYVVSRGEYFNARILAEYLGYTFVDPEWCVCFSEDGVLDLPMTLRTMGAALRPLQNAVIAGFYGADQKGIIHTFERGGSDVTGALAARAVSADLYENWTDVPGLLSADPRIVKNPGTVDYLSYRELRTLSYMGASVLHTDSVLPASNIGIPINIRSTEEPDNPGTMIVRKLPKGRMRHAVTGVAGRTGMSVIQVEKVMTSDGSGFASNILESLKRRNLPFEHCLTGIDTITLVIRSDLLTPVKEALLQELQDELQPDYLSIRDELSMIAVVGEKGTDASDANVQVLQVLTRAGIEITTINQGAGKLNLLIGVPEEHYEDAIRAIYSVIEEETA